ncbi:hypothetical protein VD0002_g5418 [Verticillium dahliae]|uniref:FAS1 domain-containing protein n=1 Tax=Verticillium dahliae TaxID=27337 RepID=A0AA45AK64_VERDA|nr:NADH dehydrogenase [ubiquinone] 1 alpha subcomplex subunit 12 [Verticillium dahliae VDG2]KAH6701861.1 beta-Ig-H3/Fasciclin [Verticillium dahliae]PNH29826.1 hypothetical protein BJF96_g6925 [Verticillium dahliae]PNH52950.1 hypothetical protein VD0003_g4437 [Verticillium dahliae]PNH62724.1 hypothetical protein VD0002_g5418 [Verticillium dahliae]
MKSYALLPFALSALVAAQDAPSLAEALASQNDTLSSLGSLLASQPALVEALSGLTNITILAPSNDALNALLQDTAVAQQVTSDPSLVAAILQYHVLNGTYRAADVPDSAVFVQSLLSNETYEQVAGSQVVGAVAEDDSVTFYSALKAESTVTQADLEFAGGVIHIIDRVLAIPANVADTATAANLTSLVEAVTKANLAETLTQAESITVFAPNNEAFAALGSLDDISEEDLQAVLQYHVIAGTVAYSSTLSEGTVETLTGETVNISIRDGNVFVNDAQVVLADVPISNGVVHVIDSVLSPAENTTGSGETSSAVPSPTAVPEAAAPRAEAAIAIGALLGGAALALNM